MVTEKSPELIFVAIIWEFRRFIMGTVTGTKNFSFLSGRTGIEKKFRTVKRINSGKFWYQKKFRNRYRKNLVPKKVLVSVSFNILGTVTH